jgi:hypothetical protein
MAKKTANPGEPKPRRVGTGRRRTHKPAGELPSRPAFAEVETASSALAPAEADPPVLDPPASAATNSWPSREDVARRAYEIYCGRGGADGQDVEDWLQAERELRAEGAGTASRRNIH